MCEWIVFYVNGVYFHSADDSIAALDFENLQKDAKKIEIAGETNEKCNSTRILNFDVRLCIRKTYSSRTNAIYDAHYVSSKCHLTYAVIQSRCFERIFITTITRLHDEFLIANTKSQKCC